MLTLECGQIVNHCGTRSGIGLWPTEFKIALALDPEPFVIGGAEVYKLFEPEINVFFLTRLNKEYSGDVIFPIDLKGWEKTEERAFSEGTFETWEKIQRMR